MIGTLTELQKAIILTIQKATPEEKRQLKQAVLKVLRSDAGVSLLEMAVVVGIIMVVAGTGIPICLSALEYVKSIMQLVAQVVVT